MKDKTKKSKSGTDEQDAPDAPETDEQNVKAAASKESYPPKRTAIPSIIPQKPKHVHYWEKE